MPANADHAELAKFDALAHRFWDPRGEFRALHALNPLRAQYVALRAPLAGARVLDVGCGGGLLAEALARAGAHVTAIDLAPGMIEVAKLHALESQLPIDYRVEDATQLAHGARGSFDIITCMEMLEHVPDPAAMLATLAQLASARGQIFVSTVNRNVKSFLLAIVGAEYVAGILPKGTHEYARLIRPAELARWGRASGLQLADVSGLAFNPLTQQCRLTADPSINYLAHFVRHGQAV